MTWTDRLEFALVMFIILATILVVTWTMDDPG